VDCFGILCTRLTNAKQPGKFFLKVINLDWFGGCEWAQQNFASGLL
jgi:hypothetical protein